MTVLRADAPTRPDAPRRSQPLTVGYVLGAYPVLSETFVSGEMRALEALGVRVEPFVFDRHDAVPDPADTAMHARARQVSALPDRLPAGLTPWAARDLARLLAPLPLRERLSVLRHAARIAAAARRTGCRWLHSHFAGGAALHALAAARMIGVGASFTVHSGIFERNFSAPTLIAPMVRAADLCIAVSQPLAAALRATGARQTAVIPCGADLARFGAAPDRPPNGRLLFVGRLIDCKGADDLLRALARQPAPCGLDIVGDGPERPALAAQAGHLGLDVRFLGALPNGWFADNGRAYLGLVAPFRRGRDGQEDSAPVVLKEALALGLPILTTCLPGVVETVADAALLVAPADNDGLTEGLATLLALPAVARADLTGRARDRARLFGRDRQGAALLDRIRAHVA